MDKDFTLLRVNDYLPMPNYSRYIKASDKEMMACIQHLDTTLANCCGTTISDGSYYATANGARSTKQRAKELLTDDVVFNKKYDVQNARYFGWYAVWPIM